MIEEGKVRIFAPSVNVRGPGRAVDVFYNREMVINRDSTIFLLSNLSVKNALDALAATGVRGIRIAKEIGIPVSINDSNPEAFEVIKKNVEINGVDAEILNRDANALMAERRFHYLDIDPFGSPVPFLDMAVRSSRILGITATDTATLAGRNRRVRRRYLSDVVSSGAWVHEVGVRNLLGYVARMAARFDLGIQPIFSMWHGHFYRVYIRVLRGSSRANRSLEKTEKDRRFGGPIWLGELHDFEFLRGVKVPDWLPTRERIEKYLEIWKNEKFLFFHHVPEVARGLRVSTPKVSKVIEKLRDMGYEAYRTQFSPEGVRSEAPVEDVKRAVLESLKN